MGNLSSPRRADLMLKTLHIAVKNSRRVRFESQTSTMVHEVPDYPSQSKLTPTVTVASIETAQESLLP